MHEFHSNHVGISKKIRQEQAFSAVHGIHETEQDRVAQEKRTTEGQVHTKNGINDDSSPAKIKLGIIFLQDEQKRCICRRWRILLGPETFHLHSASNSFSFFPFQPKKSLTDDSKRDNR